MSSKMVSLHFPVETHDNVSVRRAVGGAKTRTDINTKLRAQFANGF